MISIWILTLYTFLALSVAGYCEMRTPNSNNSLSIQDCQTFHQIQLNVGTPAISYPFLIDTGSLMTWVPTVDCNCGLGINTKISKTSKITKRSHNIKYADGDAIFGYQGTQFFSIPNTTLKGVQFPMVFVTKKQAPKIGDRGILALGFDAENIFDTAYKNGLLSSSAFTIDFGNKAGQSKIHFDKIPSHIISGSIYSPILTNLHLWAVQCKGLKVNNYNFSRYTTKTLLVDSGTTLTTFNKQLYQQLLKTVFAKCQKLGYSQQIGLLCPSSVVIPRIQFQLQGGVVYLDPSHYSVRNGDYIQVLLVPSDITILGSSFFKNYAITFDKLNGRIGFYNAAYDNNLVFYP